MADVCKRSACNFLEIYNYLPVHLVVAVSCVATGAESALKSRKTPVALSRRFDEGRPARARYVHHCREYDESELIRRARGWLNPVWDVKGTRGLTVKRARQRVIWGSRWSHFVDVNYRIVPFTWQTRSFFSPLISSQPSHPLSLRLSIYFLSLFSVALRSLFLEGTRFWTEETKGKTKSTYQMCEEQRSPESRQNSATGHSLSKVQRHTGLSRSISIVVPAAHQAWTRTHFITCLFVPYIPLATPLLLHDEIRTRDTMIQRKRSRALHKLFSPYYISLFFFKPVFRIV